MNSATITYNLYLVQQKVKQLSQHLNGAIKFEKTHIEIIKRGSKSTFIHV